MLGRKLVHEQEQDAPAEDSYRSILEMPTSVACPQLVNIVALPSQTVNLCDIDVECTEAYDIRTVCWILFGGPKARGILGSDRRAHLHKIDD